MYLSADEGVDSFGPLYIGNADNDTYSKLPTKAISTGVAFGIDIETDDEEDDAEFMAEGQHGGIINTVTTSGDNTVALVAKQWNTSGNSNAAQYKLGITVSNSGVVTTYAPTPAKSSVGNEIITAEWIKQNMSTLDFGTM